MFLTKGNFWKLLVKKLLVVMGEGKAKIAKDFREHSTIHGLPFAVKQKIGSLKFFWIVTILIAFTLLSLHLYSIISTFLQYKSSESAYKIRDGYRFPDITLCNLNGISAQNLKEAAERNSDIKAYYKTLVSTNISDRNDLPAGPGALFWALGDEAYDVGHSFHDFILECRFEEGRCKNDDFVLLPFPAFFNCFTFKRGRNVELTKTNGLRAALSMTFYLEPDNPEISQSYNGNILFANNVGLRVLIRPPNYLAAIGNAGLEFSPGLSTLDLISQNILD